MKLEYKSTFFDDLDEINEYIETNFGSAVATRVINGIHEDCLMLSRHPYLGKEYPRNTYFHYLIAQKKNLVFYHINHAESKVELHRIFDGRRDYAQAVSSIPTQP